MSKEDNNEALKLEEGIMYSMGIARRIDRLGRIVIPMEARRELNWADDTLIDITQFGGFVLLHKHSDEQSICVKMSPNHPVITEIVKAASKLPDKDMLLVLDLLRRLANG